MLQVQTLVLLERPSDPSDLVEERLRNVLGVGKGADLAAIMRVRLPALAPGAVASVLLGARTLPLVVARSDREVEVLQVKNVLDKVGFISCVAEDSGLRNAATRFVSQIRSRIAGIHTLMRDLRDRGAEPSRGWTAADIRAWVGRATVAARGSFARVVAGVVALVILVGLPAALLWWLARAGDAQRADNGAETQPGWLDALGLEGIATLAAFIVGLPLGLGLARAVCATRRSGQIVAGAVAIVGVAATVCLAASFRPDAEPPRPARPAAAAAPDAALATGPSPSPPKAPPVAAGPDAGGVAAPPFGRFVANLAQDRPACLDTPGRFRRLLCQFERSEAPRAAPGEPHGGGPLAPPRPDQAAGAPATTDAGQEGSDGQRKPEPHSAPDASRTEPDTERPLDTSHSADAKTPDKAPARADRTEQAPTAVDAPTPATADVPAPAATDKPASPDPKKPGDAPPDKDAPDGPKSDYTVLLRIAGAGGVGVILGLLFGFVRRRTT